MTTPFAVKHWGPDGTGTGVSVVVARDSRQARRMAATHLQGKPHGYRQFSSIDLLEVAPYEDFSADTITAAEPGVLMELHFPDLERPHECDVVFLRDHVQFAHRLNTLQQPLNSGRGVGCARSIVAFLHAAQFTQARATVVNESDKLSSYPTLVTAHQEIGFWPAPLMIP